MERSRTRQRSTRAASIAIASLVVIAPLAAGPSPAAMAAATTPTCAHLAHVGDSLTVRMEPLLAGAYARHGWHDPIVSAAGGRGVSRYIFDDMTGLQAVRDIQATGFTGCWVIALGTNDTAHVGDDGASPSEQHRRRQQIIVSMMDLIGLAPVMWVDVYLVMDDDPYSAAAAADWNLALDEEQPQYSNMRVFDWAPIAAEHPSWMSRDRIHDTMHGSIGRALMVTDAAAIAFGADGAIVASSALVPPAATTDATTSEHFGIGIVRRH